MAAGQLLLPPFQRPVIQPATDELEKQTEQKTVDESLIFPRENTFRSDYHQLPPIPYFNLDSLGWRMRLADLRPRPPFWTDPPSQVTPIPSLQISELVKRIAAGLVTFGLKPKDVVLLLSPNNPDFAIVYLAVVLLGTIVAPSNPLNTVASIAKQLVQVNAKLVVTIPQLLSKCGQNIHTLPAMLIGDKSMPNKLNLQDNELDFTCFRDYWQRRLH